MTDVPLRGRGLCFNCYEAARRSGELPSVPRLHKNREEVLQEYDFLRSVGISVSEMPVRIGMSREALRRALERARRDGDPRAQSWRGYTYAGRAA